MNRRLVMAGLGAGTLVGLAGCSTWRNTFKLTIEVEVDGKRQIASSVYEREINWNLGGVADRTRGTMPHMSLGQYGDIVVVMRSGTLFNRNIVRRQPLYVTEKVTWYYPPFDQGQKQPTRKVDYPKRRGDKRASAELVPVGKLLSLKVVWRPRGVMSMFQFRRIWFDELASEIDPEVRPVRITIEPTNEPLLGKIPDAPDWIKSWREQYRQYMSQTPRPSSRHDINPNSFEAMPGY